MQMASPELNDARVIIEALDEVYLANKLSNLLPYVVKMADLVTSNAKDETALSKIDKMNKIRSDFHVITSKALPLPGETAMQTEFRVTKKSSQLFEYLLNLAIVKKFSANSILVGDFFNKFLRDDLGCPINELALSDLRNNFNQFMSFNLNEIPQSPKNSKGVNPDDEKKNKEKLYTAAHVTQLTNRIAKLEKTKDHLTSRSNANVKGNSSTNASKKQRVEKYPKHDFCGRFHLPDQCYWDPNSQAYNTDAGVAWRAKFPGQKPGNMTSTTRTNVVIVNHLPVAEVDLADLNEGDSECSNIILLDGGSDSLIFNFYHLHLFTRLEPFSCSMKGISGPITNVVTHVGVIEFFGIEINAFYSPYISKSVVSEGI
jgi:hypothetical protein